MRANPVQQLSDLQGIIRSKVIIKNMSLASFSDGILFQ